MIQVEELNKIISEVSEIYNQKVRLIVKQTENTENPPVFSIENLQELRQIRKQLNLLFQIRDNCYKVLEDLELLKESFCLLN
jgi:hypothetical protein